MVSVTCSKGPIPDSVIFGFSTEFGMIIKIGSGFLQPWAG
jgi:hypothetical protein